MTHDINKSTTFYVLDIAKEKGLIISYDPNFREPLWENKMKAAETILLPIEMGYVDILKVALEELQLYASNVYEFYKMVKDKIKILFVTMGKEGSLVFFKGEEKNSFY